MAFAVDSLMLYQTAEQPKERFSKRNGGITSSNLFVPTLPIRRQPSCCLRNTWSYCCADSGFTAFRSVGAQISSTNPKSFHTRASTPAKAAAPRAAACCPTWVRTTGMDWMSASIWRQNRLFARLSTSVIGSVICVRVRNSSNTLRSPKVTPSSVDPSHSAASQAPSKLALKSVPSTSVEGTISAKTSLGMPDASSRVDVVLRSENL